MHCVDVAFVVVAKYHVTTHTLTHALAAFTTRKSSLCMERDVSLSVS